ncbi:hypothetical protein CAC01_26160 [Streptomyces sp. CLI2509]|nr:hypothetical protein CAC01_26160 [Streptomyces sp. CLI2509]
MLLPGHGRAHRTAHARAPPPSAAHTAGGRAARTGPRGIRGSVMEPSRGRQWLRYGSEALQACDVAEDSGAWPVRGTGAVFLDGGRGSWTRADGDIRQRLEKQIGRLSWHGAWVGPVSRGRSRGALARPGRGRARVSVRMTGPRETTRCSVTQSLYQCPMHLDSPGPAIWPKAR